MADRIELRGIAAAGIHGCLEHERTDPQPFACDLTLHADLSAAGASDDLADTIDYGGVVDLVTAAITGDHSYFLLEALATRICDDVLAFDPRIEQVDTVIWKLDPPVAATIDAVGVGFTRRR